MSLIEMSVGEVDSSAPSAGMPAPRTPSVPGGPRRLLRRGALEALIRAGAHRRLLLVTAPAGYGKTTSTAAALRDRDDGALVWVTLNPSDRDPVELQRHVVEALGAVGGFPVVTVPAVADLDHALANCSRQLATSDEEVVLVLDDEGEALQSRAAASRVERVLDWFPAGFHTVVLSRREPPIGTERRRARGEVAEVGVGQLALSDHEVAAYLDEVWDVELGPGTVRQVADLADGWPSLLRTMAARMATDAGVPGMEGGATPGELARLLLRELLDALAAEDHRFLMDISVFPEFDVDLCERLAEHTAVAERLARLHSVGLIVAQQTGGGYRHRPLVRELLTRELGRFSGREGALHAIAAAIHRDQGAWAEAVDHSIKAGDVDLALAWVEDHLDELLPVDHGRWLTGMFDRLPAAGLVKRSRLSMTQVDLAFLRGDRETLEATLAFLEDPGATAQDAAEMLRRVRAALSRLRGDGVEPLVSSGRGTLEPIRAHPLGVALAAEGRHEAAAAALRCALDDARRRREPLRELAILADLAWERATAGYLVDADLLVRRVRSLAIERGFAEPPLPASLASAQIELDQGPTGIARHDALQVRSTAVHGCDLAVRADAGMLVSRAQWAHGDTVGAIRALEDVERELGDHTPGGGLITRVARARASLRLALDDVEGAIACVPSVTTGPVDDLPPEDRLIAAHVQLKLGDGRSAKKAIETLREEGLGPRLTVHALRIEASACSLLGEELDAVRARRAAERIARSAGLFAFAAPRAQSRPRYVGDAQVDRPRADVAAAAPADPTDPVEELTGRELDVLQRLASSTNVEIAADLYVSVNTVKTHLKSIYRKLGVTSRDAALYEARRCRLV